MRLRLADVRWVLAAADLKRRQVDEVLTRVIVDAGGSRDLLALLRVQSGFLAVWRSGRQLAAGSLTALVQSLPASEQRALPFDVAAARSCERLAAVAQLIREERMGEAHTLCVDAMVEVRGAHGEPGVVGYGARPRPTPVTSSEDLANRFADASWRFRTSTGKAVIEAHEAAIALADWLGLPDAQRAVWERPVDVRRPRGVLDGFFSEDPHAVDRAVAALPAASSGTVTKPEYINGRTGKPERDGLACARIFGPVDDLRCLCGKYIGGEHEGTVCDKCGVLCGSSGLRDTQWGHVALPAPVVHPAHRERACAALGLTLRQLELHLDRGNEDDLEPDWDWETTGIHELARQLPAECMIEVVPVTPPGDRPDRLDRSGPEPELVLDPVIWDYRRVINRANRLRRLMELNAPPIIIINEHAMLQETVDSLLRGRDRSLEAGPAPARPVRFHPGWEEERREPAVSLLWLDDERLLVQRATGIEVDGRVYPADVKRAAWTDGRHVVFVGRYPGLSEAEDVNEVHDLAILDLEDGTWCEDWPEGLASTIVEKGEPEEAWTTDARTGAGNTVGPWSDRPTPEAWSSDGQYVWISDGGSAGAIVVGRTGTEVARVGDDAGVVCIDAGTGERDVEWDGWEHPAVPALARSGNDWWIVDSAGVVYVEDLPVFQLAGGLAFAWAPDGRLAVMLSDRVVVLRIDEDDQPVIVAERP